MRSCRGMISSSQAITATARNSRPLARCMVPIETWPLAVSTCSSIKANGWNNEQVHGGDVRRVVTQEGAPSLGRRSTSLDHVLRDAGLSDLEAELEQLAVDARRSPQWIVNTQVPDQRAQVRVNLRTASKVAGIPTPVPAEARSV